MPKRVVELHQQEYKYLSIKNWERYQDEFWDRNGKRQWIKDYTAKDWDEDFCNLPLTQRGLLDGLCRARGRYGKNLPNDVNWLSSALHLLPTDRRLMRQAVAKLVSTGFLIPTNQQLNVPEKPYIEESKSKREIEGRKEATESKTYKEKAQVRCVESPVTASESGGPPSETSTPKPNGKSQTNGNGQTPSHPISATPEFSGLPDWKNIAIAHRHYFSRKASTRLRKRYEEACAKYTEPIVMECFHAWARGAVQWVRRENVDEPLFAFFKQLPQEAEDAIALASTEIELPPAPTVDEVGDYSDEVSDIVTEIVEMWPRKNARGTPVETEVGLLAGRIDSILRKVPNVDRALLSEAARAYLENKRSRYQTPQYFFSADRGSEEAPWRAYAKMVRFRQRLEERELKNAQAIQDMPNSEVVN